MLGIDLTEDNLAPEGGRNTRAISYTKGCYLGQEPIARLDALGHVNRQLYRGTARVIDHCDAEAEPFMISSASSIPAAEIPVLSCLPVKAIASSSIQIGRLPDGRLAEIRFDSGKS